MRTTCLLAFLLGSFLLSAQETKIKKVPTTNTTAYSGKEMFGAYCASCHGLSAKGDGPAAPALKEQPADLTLLAKENGGTFPAMRVMGSIEDVTQNVHGSKEMPIWGPNFSSLGNSTPAIVKIRVTNLTKYIESLQAK